MQTTLVHTLAMVSNTIMYAMDKRKNMHIKTFCSDTLQRKEVDY